MNEDKIYLEKFAEFLSNDIRIKFNNVSSETWDGEPAPHTLRELEMDYGLDYWVIDEIDATYQDRIYLKISWSLDEKNGE